MGASSLVVGAASGRATVSSALACVQTRLLLSRARLPIKLALLKRRDLRWVGVEAG